MERNHSENLRGITFAPFEIVATALTTLWEIHIRVPAQGPVAVACKRGGERLTNDVVRPTSPSEALRVIELLLAPFRSGDRLFVTARGHDSKLSMWSTSSRSTALYWCAAAVAKLWLPVKQRGSAPASTSVSAQQNRTVA
jgi:hypothetical protein